ncbi:fluoride efflux transporter CrcB [Haloflavibacter putidus]|uniref:Fluoride-specific ion channel FluC n=1 Tax=Haloflavibacter putidus TaxID=2576776 RepID=A0A507ZVT8_9FLAO|nr:fluoride efflux transporter CrcB [Haloflavibacter putidus]TQD38885.1 fluoride efflux transporter CrcB [Haloflavibacter putidus]
MKILFLIFVGGGFGSVARFLVSKSIQSLGASIPYGTLSVNVLGSFIIGLVLTFLANKTGNYYDNIGFLLAIGFCGGFTTFSSFAFENLELLKAGAILEFAIYTISSVVLSIAAVLFAVWLMQITAR